MNSLVKEKNDMKKKNTKGFEKRDKSSTMPFMIPSIAGFLLFFLIPFFIVLFYSFIDNPINKEFVMFDNYISLLRNHAFMLSLKNTLIFSVIAVPLAVIIPLILALFLESNIPGKSIFRTALISPLVVPVASVILIWQVVFHYNGVINVFLNSIGIDAVDWFKSDFSRLVVVLLFLWKNTGYNMILFMAGLANIPIDVKEAALIDGVGPVRRFFRIKLNYMSSSIFFVTILSLINSFKVFREVYLLTGDYPYEGLYMLQHYINNTFRTLDYQKLSAAAVIICIIITAIIALLFYIDNKLGSSVDE
ncbi:MAG: sugar ABC transporter permease [Clostridia bacterium]|nr:sugar ABC transporter permease [Clostridia bacterium]MDD3093033.1 sugar ABC transporter permease [Clostridia bacterium]MDD3971719.1 sugar ABC transporter permease [Clostridia bacterium]MDD4542966.1 sugar ABC transporter permease [Clostridia bacterium]HXK72930.1 sugar ABC transporter permease [Clostridia bacterium]